MSQSQNWEQIRWTGCNDAAILVSENSRQNAAAQAMFCLCGVREEHGKGYAKGNRLRHNFSLQGMTEPELDLQRLLDGIQHLMEMRSQLKECDLSPEGAWIHEYEVKRIYPSGFIGIYRYAKWQAHEPIFKRNPKRNARPPRRGKDPEYSCHQHIGRVWSNTDLGTEPEVEEAYQQWSNRKRLEAVEEALQEIQSILARFEKVKVMPVETK